MSNELIPQEQMAKLQEFDAQMAQASNLLMNTKQIAVIQKIAGTYAKSDMVPTNYKNNEANCFVACELSARMNVSPILVMQNLYIVQGKPSWAGQACKALIDGCGRFAQSEYIFVGEEKTPGWGCYLQAFNKITNKMIKGTVVTWQMATDEGWLGKNGSKWIEAVFKACKAAPQHRYLFLTKNPKRYNNYYSFHNNRPDNFYFGASATNYNDMVAIRQTLANSLNFLSLEPLHGDVDIGKFIYENSGHLDWVIIGAETGNRKDKIIPKREWIENIVEQCRAANVPVLMKNSLADIWGGELIQEYPWL